MQRIGEDTTFFSFLQINSLLSHKSPQLLRKSGRFLSKTWRLLKRCGRVGTKKLPCIEWMQGRKEGEMGKCPLFAFERQANAARQISVVCARAGIGAAGGVEARA